MDLLMDATAESAVPPSFSNGGTLYLTDSADCGMEMDTATYLLQNEMVDIPSRSCALFPLVGDKSEIVGLFLLSVPHQENAVSVSTGEMEIVKETRTLLLSALEQYQDVFITNQSANLQKQVTKTILKEGRGAVKSVRSYAKMLSYRPTAGTLEKDMIQGIEHQGERMSDVVHRLEAALNVDPEHLPLFSPLTSDALPMTPSPLYLDN